MIAARGAGIAAALLAAPLDAQAMDHAMHGMMPGMQMPMPKAAPAPAKPRPRAAKRRSAAPAAAPHAGHDMADMPGMASAAPAPAPPIAPSAPTAAPSGTDLAPGDAPAPLPAANHLADLFYDPATMARVRAQDLRREHGGMTFRQLLFNLAERRVQRGRDAFRWDGEAWAGGDIDRLVVKSEGEGSFRRGDGRAEVQALLSRALDPYWNVQGGVRYDIRPHGRGYASMGVEGLAPYWFELTGTLFLSTRGDLLGRVEGWHDLRVTQFWVLQPRAELNLAAQAVPRDRIGAGLSDVELGLRLRYDRARRFAPYVGVSWERRSRAGLADDAERAGVGLVLGVRAWL